MTGDRAASIEELRAASAATAERRHELRTDARAARAPAVAGMIE